MKFRCTKCGCLLKTKIAGSSGGMIIPIADGLCEVCEEIEFSKKRQEPLTLYNAPVGTIIKDYKGKKYRIFAVLNEGENRVVLISKPDAPYAIDDWYLVSALSGNEYKVVEKCKECGKEL